jgi:hypothetical protein
LCRFGRVEVFRQSLRLVNETARRVSDMRPPTGLPATWDAAIRALKAQVILRPPLPSGSLAHDGIGW